MPNRNSYPYDSNNRTSSKTTPGRPPAGRSPAVRSSAQQLAVARNRRMARRRRTQKRIFGFIVLLLIMITVLVYFWSQKDIFADKFASLSVLFGKDTGSEDKNQGKETTGLDDENGNNSETTATGSAQNPDTDLGPYAKDGIDFRLNAQTPFFVGEQRAIVLIDPGHGGMDGGAPGYLGDGTQVVESGVVLDIARKLQEDLNERNIESYIIRDDDTFISLYARVARASSLALDYMAAYQPDTVSDRGFIDRMQTAMLTPIEINSDNPTSGGFGFMQGYGMNIDQIRLLDLQQECSNIIFVSLHCNAHETNESLHGMQAYYCHDDYVEEDESAGLEAQTTPSGHLAYSGRDNQRNEELAQSVYDGATSKVPQLAGTNAGKPVLAGNYAVLREHGLAGTLIEIGYMSNSDDLNMLTDQQIQSRLAEGIGAGIADYFKKILS